MRRLNKYVAPLLFLIGVLVAGGALGVASIYLPSSSPPGLFIMATLALVGIGIAVVRRCRRPPNLGRCPRCGFDLRATPYRCPECGDVWLLRER
jgi:predicted RNA-binding Zn-ribbon protein involved in translation (DUF1610 family)